MIEFIMTAPQYPVQNITTDGKPVYSCAITKYEKKRKEIYPDLSDGALEFAKDIKAIFGRQDIFLDVIAITGWLNKFADMPMQNDKKYMAEIYHSEGIAHTQYAPIFSVGTSLFNMIFHPRKTMRLLEKVPAVWLTEAQAKFMEKRKIKVSVIVPVYNVAPYLENCLKSLVRQTLKEIEIICIDDKSTDNSLKILRKYAGKYKKIKVISFPENRGIPVARNAGLAAASGQYLGFVDSDDWVDLDFYKKLYERAIAAQADIVRAKIVCSDIEGNEQPYADKVEDIRKNCNIYNYFWSSIYRHSMVKDNKIDFPENIKTGQDVLFLIKSQCFAQKTQLLTEDVFYHYLRRDDSMDCAILNDEKIKSRIMLANMSIDFINNADIEAEKYSIIFKKRLDGLNGCISRTDTMKNDIAKEVVALWGKCKYPDKYESSVKSFLQFGDVAALVRNARPTPSVMIPKKRKHKAFQIIIGAHTKTIKLFGFPLLDITKS
jgi:glycosyltransferase involved in cell wall biosynthesis